MQTRTINRRSFLQILGITALGGSSRALAQNSDPICVVVSIRSAQKELQLNTLRRIFYNLPTDDDGGNRVLPLNAAPKSAMRVRFDDVVFGVDADEMARYWVDQKIRGIMPPRIIPDLNILRGLVAKWPGAVTYLPRSQLTTELKPLRINGKAPGEPGYILNA
jgi:hypothetical protein